MNVVVNQAETDVGARNLLRVQAYFLFATFILISNHRQQLFLWSTDAILANDHVRLYKVIGVWNLIIRIITLLIVEDSLKVVVTFHLCDPNCTLETYSLLLQLYFKPVLHTFAECLSNLRAFSCHDHYFGVISANFVEVSSCALSNLEHFERVSKYHNLISFNQVIVYLGV